MSQLEALRRWAFVGGLAATVSCRTSSDHAGASAGASASATSALAVVSASAAPSAVSVPARAPLSANDVTVGKGKIMDAARRLVAAWNAALNAHDATALAAVYAPKVSFYGQNQSRDQVLAGKRAALAKSPDFKQSLSDVQFVPRPSGDVEVKFKKTSQGATVPAELVVAGAGSVYAIVVETDSPTEALEQKRLSCEDTMYDVATNLPAVKRMYAEAGPDARPGGLFYPAEGNDRSLSLGFDHDDHFENVYFVDWKAGKFTVHSGGDDASLPIPPDGLARVTAKCPK